MLAAGPFRRLVEGQGLAQAADGLAQITIAQVVLFEVGGGATPWEIAKLLMATVLPFSVVGPFAGVVIDRWDRRRTMVVTSVARAVLMIAATSIVLLDSQALGYVAGLLVMSSSRFLLAAKAAALPNTIQQRADLVTANALSSIIGMSSAFVGAVGGSLFVGPAPTLGFVVAALLYVASGIRFLTLPSVGGGRDTEALASGVRRTAADLASGVRTAVMVPNTRRALGTVMVHRFLLGAWFVMLVLIADQRYGLEASGYGLALAVTGVGAFLGTALAPALARRYGRGAMLPVSFALAAVAAVAAGASTTLALMVAGAGVAALGSQVLKVVVDAVLQETTPDATRGRLFALYDVGFHLAFVVAAMALVPVWSVGREGELLLVVAVAFGIAGVVLARSQLLRPFGTTPHEPAGD